MSEEPVLERRLHRMGRKIKLVNKISEPQMLENDRVLGLLIRPSPAADNYM